MAAHYIANGEIYLAPKQQSLNRIVYEKGHPGMLILSKSEG
jgi:hypothetical protein